jgi:tetratricopeptide (TPR) repeat protein
MMTPTELTAPPGNLPEDLLEAGLAVAFRAAADTDSPSVPTEQGSRPARRPAPAADPPLPAGDRYRFGPEIARGGMGVVLEARDEALGRELAVKVLSERYRDDPAMRRRFVEEARIGGQLQHPGIVPVYDLGESADRSPYFTMKLVRGRTLAEWLAGRPDPADDRPRLLAVVLQVCQAVAYAHARGIVHRDLKPSNVMVGAFGEVQVMDWGLAKVLGGGEKPGAPTARDAAGGSASRAGTVMGTLSYMPPEQARGESARLDERADVFALGGILCAVLTGQAPYGGDGTELHTRAMVGDLGEAYDRLGDSGADAELTSLVRRCLAAQPEGRPRDAGAVAAELAAYLDGAERRQRAAELAAAAARAHAAGERKRRRLTAALAAAVLAAVLLAGGGWAWVERDRTARRVERTARAYEALAAAAGLFELAGTARAGDAVPWERAAAAAQRLRELLATGDVDAPARARAEDLLAAIEAGRRAAEDRHARAEFDRDVRTELDEIRLGVQTDATEDGFDHESAAAAYERAFRAYGIVPREQRAADVLRASAIRTELIAALDDWIAATRNLGLRARLAEIANAAEDDPDSWPARLRAALVAHDRRALNALATADLSAAPPATLALWARALRDADELPAAERFLREAHRRAPGDFWVNVGLTEILHAESPLRGREASALLGAVAAFRPHPGPDDLVRFAAAFAVRPRPRPEEAARFATAAVAVRPESPGAHNNLGVVLVQAGRSAEALSEFREAAQLRPGFAKAHTNAGVLLLRLGRQEAAEASFREALRHRPGYSPAMNQLADLWERQGRLAEAEAYYRDRLRRRPDSAAARNDLGVVLGRLGRDDEAAAEFRRAAELDPELLLAHVNLGHIETKRGKHSAAESAWAEVVWRRPESASARHYLGNARFDQGDWAGSEAAFREALRLDPRAAGVLNDLGNTLHNQNRLDEALACFRQAAHTHPGDAIPLSNIGNLLGSLGRYADAEAVCREAVRLNPAFASAHNGLGVALRGQGRLEEAIAAHREAVRLRPDLGQAYHHLALALWEAGRNEEAEDAQRMDVCLAPGSAAAHRRLGNFLRDAGRPAEAADSYRAAIRLGADTIEPYHSLALILDGQGRADDAIELWRAAALRFPRLAAAHNNLGAALGRSQRYGAAADAYRAALRLGPEHTTCFNLGEALRLGGRPAEAEAAYRDALRLAPDFFAARFNLAFTLRLRGEFAASLEEYRRAAVFAPADQAVLCAGQVRLAESLLRRDERLRAVLGGAAAPNGARGRLELADFALKWRKEYAAAARLYEAALVADPGLAADRRTQFRYDAACAAALAGTREENAEVATRCRWLAAGWLREEVTSWSSEMRRSPEARRAAADALQHWQVDVDLAGVRESESLGRLAWIERLVWVEFWAGVAALEKQARSP